MTDDVKDALELARSSAASKCQCIDCRALRVLIPHIDGEPARLAAALETQLARLTRELSAEVATARENFETRLRAAVAAAREEQREACAKAATPREVEVPDDDGTFAVEDEEVDALEIVDRVRATPLTAKPLADEIAALRKERDDLKEETYAFDLERLKTEDEIAALRAQVAELSRALRDNSQAHIATGRLREEAEAERDEKEVERAALETTLMAFKARFAEVLAERDARFDCKGGPGTAAPACGGCTTCLHRVIQGVEAERDGYRKGCESLTEAVNVVVAERDALRATVASHAEGVRYWTEQAQAEARDAAAARAQVEAARALCEAVPTDDSEDVRLMAADVLRAMDEGYRKDAERAEKAESKIADLEYKVEEMKNGLDEYAKIASDTCRLSFERAEKAEAELDALRTNIEACLAGGPSIRVCEGGGPEDLAASLAVTMLKLRSDYDAFKAQLAALTGPACSDATCPDHDGNHPYHLNAIEKFWSRVEDTYHGRTEDEVPAVATWRKDLDKLKEDMLKLRMTPTRIIEMIRKTKWHPGGATGAVNPERIIEAIQREFLT